MADEHTGLWAPADKIAEIRTQLAFMRKTIEDTLASIDTMQCLRFEGITLGEQRAAGTPAPRPSDVLRAAAQATMVPAAPVALTPEQIRRAATYRRNMGRLPDWLPETITQAEQQRIIKLALEQNLERRSNGRFKESTAQRVAKNQEEHDARLVYVRGEPTYRRRTYKSEIAAIRAEHGEDFVNFIKRTVGKKRNVPALDAARRDFLGTYPTPELAGIAFAEVHGLPILSKGDALLQLAKAKRQFRHKDGKWSVWTLYAPPEEKAAPKNQAKPDHASR